MTAFAAAAPPGTTPAATTGRTAKRLSLPLFTLSTRIGGLVFSFAFSFSFLLFIILVYYFREGFHRLWLVFGFGIY